MKSGKQSSLNNLSNVMNDPMQFISFFIQQGDPEMLKGIIDKIDMLKNGADCLQIACAMGKEKMVEFFIEKGVDVLNPPELV